MTKREKERIRLAARSERSTDIGGESKLRSRAAKYKDYMDINDITYKIRAAIFEVQKELGGGFLENVYEQALIHELRSMGLKVESQVPITVRYKGNIVGEYLADIIVEGLVIIELKAVEKLVPAFEAQLMNYLKATGIKVGMLVNFKHPKADIKRIVMDL